MQALATSNDKEIWHPSLYKKTPAVLVNLGIKSHQSLHVPELESGFQFNRKRAQNKKLIRLTKSVKNPIHIFGDIWSYSVPS